jgi:hypothetical protein
MDSLRCRARRHMAGWRRLTTSAVIAVTMGAFGTATAAVAAPVPHHGSVGERSHATGTVAGKGGSTERARVRHAGLSAPADGTGAVSTDSPVTASSSSGAVTVPGTEWSRAISCVTETECILIAADTSSPLNGDADTLVPMKISGGLGDPVKIQGMTEAVAIGCDPGLASRCIVAGDSGSLGGTITGKFVSVGPPVSGKPKLYQVQDTPGVPAAVTCVPGSSTCVLAEDSGVQVVSADGTPGAWSAHAGLDALSVACSVPLPRPSPMQCLILTNTGFIPFTPGTGTFGKLQNWASVSLSAKVACYPTVSSCVAVTNDPSLTGSSIVADISLSTGKVTHQQSVAQFSNGGVTCASASNCLGAGFKGTEGSAGNPEILPIINGIPQGVSVFSTGESGTLDSIACAGAKITTCLGAGAESTSLQPGLATVGMLLPVTVNGTARSWTPGNPTPFYQRYTVGVMVATDPVNGDFFPCTATVVTSGGHDLVIAAAHCVQDISGSNTLYKNIYFAPDHRGPVCNDLKCGTNPIGVWTAQTSDITVWKGPGGVSANQRLDWSFVTVHPASGALPLQAMTGGMRIAFNPSYTQSWTVYGYPVGSQINPGVYADKFISCSGSSSEWASSPSGSGPDELFISGSACSAMTAGASGGPWFTSSGKVGAVNKASGSPGLLGTYLGNEAKTAYTQAGGG